jgi:hypothetical protein
VDFGFSSREAKHLVVAPAHPGEKSLALEAATSGKSQDGSRVIEGRIAWRGLLHLSFGALADSVAEAMKPAPGLTIGCEPMLIEQNHKRQSYIGGAHYKKPTGDDANSIDLRLVGAK